MIIDSHVHISNSGTWFSTKRDSSVEKLIYDMDDAGIDKAILLPVPGSLTNTQVLDVLRDYKQLFACGMIDLSKNKKQVSDDVCWLKDNGFVGIKFHPRFQRCSPNSEAAYNLYEAAQEYKLPIVTCTWQQCCASDVLIKDLSPITYDKIAKEFPELKIVLAHMGGHNVLDAYFVAKSNENIYLDTSFVFSKLKDTSVYKDLLFVMDKLDRKVLFGTDFPEIKIGSYLRQIDEIINDNKDISKDDIYSNNAQRVFMLDGL